MPRRPVAWSGFAACATLARVVFRGGSGSASHIVIKFVMCAYVYGAMAEADRLGMDGAPLSDYLNMLRRQVVAYRRDIVVISLICDHFHQSCDFLKTHDAPFMKLERFGGQAVRKIVLVVCAGRPRSAISTTKSGSICASRMLSAAISGAVKRSSIRATSRPRSTCAIRDHEANRFFWRCALREIAELSRCHDFKLLFVMDGVREAICAMEPREWLRRL